MRIGYARVSTASQTTDSQDEALAAASCERVFRDTGSGATVERPQLVVCLSTLRPGDVLVVRDLSRLGRSLAHLVQLGADLRARGVELVSLREGIDSTTAQGRLTFGVFAALAEFERELIHERVMEGLAAAVARGRRGGRPARLTAEQVDAARQLSAAGKSLAAIARTLDVSRSTLYRALRVDLPS